MPSMEPRRRRGFAEKAKGRLCGFSHHTYSGFTPVYEELPKIHDMKYWLGGRFLRGVENTPAGDYSLNSTCGPPRRVPLGLPISRHQARVTIQGEGVHRTNRLRISRH
jgi:hypothetical protein